MSRISIIIPVYYNSDTLMMLYEDMKEKQLPDEFMFVFEYAFAFIIV